MSPWSFHRPALAPASRLRRPHSDPPPLPPVSLSRYHRTRYGTGGAEKIDEGADERRMALGSTEGYVEYSRDGRVLRGAAKAVAKSKYPEDIMVNNHTKVWGSWFDPRIFRWGYGDDHSLVRNSYSTGEAGKEANDAANAGIGSAMGSFKPSRPMLEAVPADQRQDSNPLLERSKLYGEGDKGAEFDQDKLKVHSCTARIGRRRSFAPGAIIAYASGRCGRVKAPPLHCHYPPPPQQPPPPVSLVLLIPTFSLHPREHRLLSRRRSSSKRTRCATRRRLMIRRENTTA